MPSFADCVCRWLPLLAAFASGCSATSSQPPGTVDLDFYRASGIRQDELADWLKRAATRESQGEVPLLLTLHNSRGDILAQSRVIVAWDSGTHRLLVPRSGLIGFPLTPEKLPGLKLIAPAGYTILKQRTLPLGDAYAPEEEREAGPRSYQVTYDDRLLGELKLQLVELQDADAVLDFETVQAQLRRQRAPLELPPPLADELTPAEIYRLRRNSVVIVGSLHENGQVLHGGGVILARSGVIVTNYHVLDKPPAVRARGVLTADRQFYPLVEILAADRAADVAVIRVAATDLSPAPLSRGDPEGSAVTVISHPGGNFFTLTQGHISRYWASTRFGRTAVTMTMTADFAEGSSGGPVFNSRGAVTAIVSATRPLGYQMVMRDCAPVEEIRRLLAQPADDSSATRRTAPLGTGGAVPPNHRD